MSWNGSGIYTLPPLYSPEVNGTVIDAARYNGLTNDVAVGINNCLTKDGQNVPTANLPMGGFKHTGLADGTAAGQSINFNQTGVASLLGNLRVGHASLTGLRSITAFSSSDIAPAGYRSGTVAAFLRSSSAGVSGGISVISGNTSVAFLTLGDTDSASQGGVEYNNATEALSLRAGGANRVTVTDVQLEGTGILGCRFDAFSTTTDNVQITDTNGVLLDGNTTLGYAPGEGIVVTQGAGAARNVAVTANRRAGIIFTNNASIAAGATVSFSVTNSFADDPLYNPVILGNLDNVLANTWRLVIVRESPGFRVDLTNITGVANTTPIGIAFICLSTGFA